MPLKTYIRLAGTNGFLPGPIDLPGRENGYPLLEGAHAVRMLRQRSNGFTGTRHLRFHEPFFASFPLDKAYPSLMECLCHGGTLPVVEISLWDLVEGSVEEEPKEKRVFLYTLENVRLTQVRTLMRGARVDRLDGGILMQARVGMVYDKVTWLHDEGYILFWDSLKDTGKEEAKPEEDWGEAEPGAAPEKKAVEVLLQNPLWDVAEVGFNEEATLSVDCELPEEYKSRKRVQFVLFAKTPKGPEQIAKADGFTENGRASCKMPVYKPRYRGEDGEGLQEVEYFFTAKHTLSEPVDSGAKPEGVKSVDKMADPLIDTHVVAGVTFGFDGSFLHPNQIPNLKALCDQIAAWRKSYPDGKMALFGHTDAVGKESYNKGLSERRARSVYAFLMGDPSVWEDLHKEENWSFACTQALVKQAGYDPGAIDGLDGPKTQGAVKGFQELQGLKADGIAGPQTREALFIEFMRAVPEAQKLALMPKHFDKVDGQPHMGCSEFNRVEVTEGKSEANRRVTVVLVKSTQTFPVEYPCKRGNIGPCQGQVKKAGERRTEGFGCAFYDGLVVEESGLAITEVEWDKASGLAWDKDNRPEMRFGIKVKCKKPDIEGVVLEIFQFSADGKHTLYKKADGLKVKKGVLLGPDNVPVEIRMSWHERIYDYGGSQYFARLTAEGKSTSSKTEKQSLLHIRHYNGIVANPSGDLPGAGQEGIWVSDFMKNQGPWLEAAEKKILQDGHATKLLNIAGNAEMKELLEANKFIHHQSSHGTAYCTCDGIKNYFEDTGVAGADGSNDYACPVCKKASDGIGVIMMKDFSNMFFNSDVQNLARSPKVLIFSNCCLTAITPAYAEVWIQKGTRWFIGWALPVGDNDAVEFAKAFYRRWMNVYKMDHGKVKSAYNDVKAPYAKYRPRIFGR